MFCGNSVVGQLWDPCPIYCEKLYWAIFLNQTTSCTNQKQKKLDRYGKKKYRRPRVAWPYFYTHFRSTGSSPCTIFLYSSAYSFFKYNQVCWLSLWICQIGSFNLHFFVLVQDSAHQNLQLTGPKRSVFWRKSPQTHEIYDFVAVSSL